MKLSESGKVIHDLLDLIDQYMLPSVRNMVLSDLRYVNAKKYLCEYKANLSWTSCNEFPNQLCANVDIGTYYIIEELNKLTTLQFNDYVLKVSTTEDIENFKELAETDYIYRVKSLQKVS